MTSSIQQIITFRARALEKWRGRAHALELKENELHQSMDPGVAAVVKGKRLLLFGEMLATVGFPEHQKLVHLMASGFPVAGAYPATGVFPPADRRASLDLADLWKKSKTIQSKIVNRRGGSDDTALDQEVFGATLLEVEKGWLKGPFSADELTRRLGCWVPSRRFGVRQGEKMRCIDDFAASGVNDALSASETVDPDGLDRIAVNVRGHLDAFTAPLASRPATSPFSSCRRHHDHAEARLLARMWDLESAYRQLPRAPCHASLTVIAVWNPTAGRHDFFEQPPLGFGASASVLSFNWVAEALKAVLVDLFAVALTAFYDDFTVIEVEGLAANAREIVEEIFRLLGWRLKPLADFAPELSPLGAVLDLGRCREGVAIIRNKESRVKELVAAIDAAGSAAAVPADLLPRLRGRLLFARSLAFGRCGGDALRALGDVIQMGGRTVLVKGQLARSLYNLRRHLVGARPREVRVAHPAPPLLFVDGAFETDSAGNPQGSIGGVLLDPLDAAFEFFRMTLAAEQVAFLLGELGKTAIFQLEILPVLASRILWERRLRDRALLCFCDNDAAKAALIGGYSPQPIAVQILARIADRDVRDGALSWYERVPTTSNPADAPSRMAVPEPLPGWSVPVELGATDIVNKAIADIRVDAIAELEGSALDPRRASPGVQ